MRAQLRKQVNPETITGRGRARTKCAIHYICPLDWRTPSSDVASASEPSAAGNSGVGVRRCPSALPNTLHCCATTRAL